MRTSLVSLALSSLLLVSGSALAQSATLAGPREALTRYDLAGGSASLRALGELAPIATGSTGDAAEARAMRALAGAEMWAAATLLGDDGARLRVAGALGVTLDDATSHLRTELGAIRGAYRAAARESVQLLDVLATYAADGAALAAATGPRRDAALALFVAGHRDPSALAAVGSDVTDAAASGWDERSRRALGALREAVAATARARRAAASGDPLLALLDGRLAAIPGAITGIELRPSIDVAETIGLPTVEGGTVVPFDALLLVAEREVHVALSPIVRVDSSGALVSVRAGDVLPAMRTIAVPADLPAVPHALDDVAAAVAALGLSSGAVVIVAPTGTAPAHVLTRVLLSCAHASLTVTHLGAERADETLVAIPFSALRAAEAGTSDVHTRIRLGGYSVARGDHGDTTLPRVRDEAGSLGFDAAGLRTFLGGGAHATLSLEAMATVSGGDVVRTAFLAVDAGATVRWLLP